MNAGPFPKLAGERKLRWRRLDGPGLELLVVAPDADGVAARGVVLRGDDAGVVRIAYEIGCDAMWRCRRVTIETTRSHFMALTSPEPGVWQDADETRVPAFDGCVDIDLGCTPFTNTLPIRRLGDGLGEEPVELSTLFVPFDTFAPFVDRQRYRRLPGRNRYRFEAVDGSFAADIVTDDDGLVVDYPPLFARSDRISPP